jgi:hypothetical protein
MNFTTSLEEADIVRSQLIPTTTQMYFDSHHTAIEACDRFALTYITPVVIQQLLQTDREKVLFGLYYRMTGYARSVVALKHPVHFQSIA